MTELQIGNITHALGLNYRKIPFRNRYNTGNNIDESWENLVQKEYATKRVTCMELGGCYYHLSKKGLQYVLDNKDIFGLDGRIKKLDTIYRKANL